MQTIETGLTPIEENKLPTVQSLVEISEVIPADKRNELAKVFKPHAQEIIEFIQEARNIAVTGENDTVGMKAARDHAKKGVAVIKALDATHKEQTVGLKNITGEIDRLRKGMKDVAVETKDQLRHLADTAKRAEEERRQKLGEERRALLLPFLAPGDHITADLSTMDDETFETILEGQKAKKNQREQQAKIEALEREKALREKELQRQKEIEEAQERARIEAEEQASAETQRLKREAEELRTRNAELQASAAQTTVKIEARNMDADRIQTAAELAQDLIDKYADSMDGDVIEYLETFLN